MDEKKLIANYKKNGEEILYKMIKVLMKAQRKAEDKKYRETLEKLKLV